MYVYPDLLVEEIILALEADTTLFPAGMLLRLYTNNLTPTKSSVIGDFTQLTNVQVPGYAAVAIAWDGTPVRNQDGAWVDYGTDALFSATGAPPAPQIVYGWYMTDAANTVLVGSGRFATAFTYVQTGDGLRLEPVLQANQTTGTVVELTTDMLIEG